MQWRFVGYEVRTTEVAAAERFYRAVGITPDAIGELPAQARARGAPAHWLGHLATADATEAAAALVGRGAAPLGPPRVGADGRLVVALRDPAGAVLAVTTAADSTSSAGVVLHVLNTRAPERAVAAYADLAGWRVRPASPLPAPLGRRWDLADTDDGPSWGVVLDVTAAPHIHDHWLYGIGVPDLTAALAHVVATGGRVDEPVAIGAGRWSGHCHDPQGAAFTLVGPR